MDSISQVIHDCETCAAIKQAQQVKPLWYGGRWFKYKYGEAWQIDSIPLPQTRQGKRYVLTMVEATTGWLETDPVPHTTAQNTILGLEKQVLWRHAVHNVQNEQMSNSSSIRHFLLLALADTRQLQLLHFCLLLGISLAALLGNGLIISAVACGHHLHTPMFFFLLNLALSDLGSICTTVPKAMHNSLWDTSTISYSACAAQMFFFIFFIAAEYFLLTIMCYDRYVSICKPLHYGTLLGSRACAHMAAAAWASAFLTALLHTANTFSLPLCHGNALGQFFCEVPQILKLSCSHSTFRKIWISLLGVCLGFGCFVFIVFSYVQIFRAVLRIPSEQGRHKAFSTCLPHLAVVSLFLSTGFFAYLKPPSISSPSLDLAVSVLYSVVPPALNPLIYSLRNQELKAAVWRLMAGWFQKH
ncbi:olfactory receptor 14A16-like [Agelaius tricolor]|uniref:olfactory receptor 14A16-like n=1 Tax=Agelaius tricolor TaxID=9191 RepID=UPI0039F20C5D